MKNNQSITMTSACFQGQPTIQILQSCFLRGGFPPVFPQVVASFQPQNKPIHPDLLGMLDPPTPQKAK